MQKSVFYYLVLVVLIFSMSSCKKQRNRHLPTPDANIPPGAKYAFERGMVEYEMEQLFRTVTIQFWKDYGKVIHQMTIVPLTADTTHLLFINDTLYSWKNNSMGKAVKVPITQHGQNLTGINFRELTDSLLQQFRIEKLPSEKVDNYPCEVFKMPMTDQGEMTAWVWEGIPVKIVVSSPMMTFVMKAKKIEVNQQHIPSYLFEVPKHVTFTLMQDSLTRISI